ncbi:MAG: hypothetical protein PHR68_01545 [Candidatus Gracilibacteria bacterium]|nr:hypothetical protein [Candidatus Gracilibacteria bacterium]
MKEKLIEILKQKQNKLTEKIIANIDHFSEQEIYEMYAIMTQEDIEKLKEAWHFKNKQLMQTIDKINMIGFEIKKIEKQINTLEETREQTDIIQIENNLNLAF